MTAPTQALGLSVAASGGDTIVAVQVTYTWIGSTFGESAAAPVATLRAPVGTTIRQVRYQTSETAPNGAYAAQFYLREGTGDPSAPTWSEWFLWQSWPASYLTGGFDQSDYVIDPVPAAGLAVFAPPPEVDEYDWSCLDCVDSGPRVVSRTTGDPSWHTYLVCCTWLDAAGHETRAQGIGKDTSLISGVGPISTATWQPREKHFHIIPAGAVAARWYVNPPTDPTAVDSDYAGWRHAADVPVVSGDVADWTMVVADAGSWPAATLPLANATCRAPIRTIRLVHPTGDIDWEHDGHTWTVRSDGELAQTHDGTTHTVYSGGHPVFETPFPTSADPTDNYLGLHPTTGLPIVAPLPKLVPLAPPVVTPPMTTCVQLRCGAADALVNKLADTYHTIEQWVQVALTGLLGAFFDALAGAGFTLLDLVTDGLGFALTPEELAIVATVSRTIGFMTAGVLGDALPFLNSDQQTWLKQAAFDSLVCTNDSVQLDGSQMDAWYNRILHASGNPPNFGFIQQEALYGIVGWGRDLALSDWAVVANTGAHSPSIACDSWS